MKGNFYLNIGVRNKRIFVQPIFTLNMKKEDETILKKLKEEVGVGEIKVNKNAVFVVRGIQNVLKFLEVIEEEKIITSKKRDWILWKEAAQLIKYYKHLSKEGFLRICEIRDRMNVKKKRRNYRDRNYFERLIEIMNIRFENEDIRKKISSSLRTTFNLQH